MYPPKNEHGKHPAADPTGYIIHYIIMVIGSVYFNIILLLSVQKSEKKIKHLLDVC